MHTQKNATVYDSAGLATGGVVAAHESDLQGFIVTNASGSIRYLQFFNATSVPADATVPVIAPFILQPGSTASFDVPDGFAFTTGISWASSSTLATKTITGTADLWVTAVHE